MYEDWRADMDARIADLYSQMNDEEKASLFIHVNTCGNPAGADFNDSRNMWEQNCPFDVPAEGEVVNGPVANGGSYSMWYYINVYGVTHFLSNDNGAADLQVKFITKCSSWVRILVLESRLLFQTTASTMLGAA